MRSVTSPAVMYPSGSWPSYRRPGRRLCQFGVSSRSESQRSRRQEFATSPRSSTTWSIERSLRKRLADRPACPAPMTTAVMRSMTKPPSAGFIGLAVLGHFDGDVGRVAQRVVHCRALLRLRHQRLDVLAGRVRVDVEGHLDVVEAVADVAVGTEDAADVVGALDRRGDRAQLDAAVLGDRGHAGRQAAGQADDEVLDRRDAVVGRREDLGVVGLEDRLLLVGLLLAEAEEAVDLDLAVDAVLPGGGGAPGELSGLRRALEDFARVEQRLDVNAIRNCCHT